MPFKAVHTSFSSSMIKIFLVDCMTYINPNGRIKRIAHKKFIMFVFVYQGSILVQRVSCFSVWMGFDRQWHGWPVGKVACVSNRSGSCGGAEVTMHTPSTVFMGGGPLCRLARTWSVVVCVVGGTSCVLGW
jgi:hypothetical protein